MTQDMEEVAFNYIVIRDGLADLKKEYEDKKKPLQQALAKLEGTIAEFMNANNLTALKTKAGTCYNSTEYRASLADPDIFMKYVIDNKAFDLLERRASTTAVKDFVKDHKELPPGCNLSATQSVGVRRPTK